MTASLYTSFIVWQRGIRDAVFACWLVVFSFDLREWRQMPDRERCFHNSNQVARAPSQTDSILPMNSSVAKTRWSNTLETFLPSDSCLLRSLFISVCHTGAIVLLRMNFYLAGQIGILISFYPKIGGGFSSSELIMIDAFFFSFLTRWNPAHVC